MSAEVNSVLAEITDSTSDDINIVGTLIAAEHGVELTAVQVESLDAVLLQMHGLAEALRKARKVFA